MKITLPEDIEGGDHSLTDGATYHVVVINPQFHLTKEMVKDILPDIIFNVAYSTKDTQAPNITLNGKDKVIVAKGETYEDTGAAAQDDRDKNVDVKVTSYIC